MITSYNNGGDTSRRPILNGDGTVADKDEHSYLAFDAWRGFYPSGTIELFNVEYWEVRGIEITNYTSTYSQEATGRNGIAVIHDYLETQGLTSLPSGNVALEQAFYRAGKLQHIVVEDCYIHDVTGFSPDSGAVGKGGKMSGGINVYGPYDDLKLNNNIVMYCDVEGIRNDVLAWMGDTKVQFPDYMEGVEINNNFIVGVPGDGIVISSASYPKISNNYLTDAGYSYFVPKAGTLNVGTDKAKAMGNRSNPIIPGNNAYAGMWFIGTYGAAAEYNELVNNVWTNQDGEAFDADMYTWGTVFQYNYTYRNNGGLCLFMSNMGEGRDYADGDNDNIFRYNISVQDGEGTGIAQDGYHGIFHYEGTPAAIYNNLIVLGDNVLSLFGGKSNTAFFYNNIVIKPDGELNSKFALNIDKTSTSSKTALKKASKVSNNLFYPASLADETVLAKCTHENNITPDDLSKVFKDLDGFLASQPVKALKGRSAMNGTMSDAEGRSVATPTGGFNYSKFKGIKTVEGSPTIGAGVAVEIPINGVYWDYEYGEDYALKYDFFQNDISGVAAPDIGPDQWSPDVQVTGAALQRSAITMWTNDETKPTDDVTATEVGTTAPIEVTVSPSNATDPTIVWASDKTDMAFSPATGGGEGPSRPLAPPQRGGAKGGA